MMRLLKWVSGLLLSLLVLHAARALKWPASNDPYEALKEAATAVKPYIPKDSLTAIRIQDVPEDYMLYLRYQLIPARATFDPGVKSAYVLLLVPSNKINSVTDSLQRNSDLLLLRQTLGQTVSTSLFKTR